MLQKVTFILFFIFCVLRANFAEENVHYPVVVWHGMAASCCHEFYGELNTVFAIFDTNPNIKYVRSLQIGATVFTEIWNSLFMDVSSQVRMACNILRSDKYLKGGYNAIGMSQGGLFMRAVAQTCPDPPMKKLITFGSPHMGTYGIPDCEDPVDETWKKWCERLLRWTIQNGTYRFYRSLLVPMEYWNSPFSNHASAVLNNSFLMRINNSYTKKNEKYKKNLLQLELLVLVKYGNDNMIKPSESAWFGFYAPGTTETVLEMKETDLYKEDRIGLKILMEENKIHFLEVKNAYHLMHSLEWLEENIINKYL